MSPIARARADRAVVIVARLAAVLLVAALSLLLASCAVLLPLPEVVPADYFHVLDPSRCPRRATWYVRPAYTFHGVTFPADSTLARDSVVDPFGCARGAR